MNDPVLNRTLFRHQAQIIHNKIPRYVEGGDTWQKLGSQFKAKQAAAQKYFKGADKLRLLGSLFNPVGGPKRKLATAALKQGWKGFQYTGIPRVVKEAFGAKGTWTGRGASWAAKKAPKTYAGAKIGVGGGLGYLGVKDIYQGVKEGDPGKAAMGAGEALFGPGIFLRGRKLWQYGKGIKTKEGIAAFRKAADKARKWDKSKWSSGLLSMPLFLGGAYAAKGEPKYDRLLSEISKDQKDEIWDIIKTVAKDIKNVTEKEKNKAIEIWVDQQRNKEDKPDTTKPENLGEGATPLEAESTVPKSGSPVNTTEAGILQGQKEQDAKAEADALKTKFNNSDMATQREFLKFRQSISDLTGTYGNDRDLILMKMASGMMTGKTGQKGLRGFMDVTGQAMGPTVDTALALSNAQKGRDTDLATAFLKMKGEEAKAAEGGGIKLKGELKTFIVADPANEATGYRGSLYGFKVVQGQFDENSGLIYEMGTNQSYSLLGGTNIREAKGSGAQLQKSRSKLSSMGIGLDYVNHILYNMPDDLKGVTGWAKLLTSDWINESSTWSGMQNKYTQGADTLADYVNTDILNPSNFLDENGKQIMTTDAEGKEITEYDWAVQNLQNEDNKDRENAQKANSGMFGLRVTTEELDQLTKAALIENRLKYIIANANKSEDRLTRWDIENAEKSTSVLSFFSFKRRFSAAGVNSQMRALQDELQNNFNKEGRNYQQLGGTNDYLLNFNSVKKIRDWNVASGMEVADAELPDILDTIEIPQAMREGGFVGA